MSNGKASEILKATQELYLNGEYDEAISNLLDAKGSLDQGLFHYNLGSLYLKKEQIGPARLNLEKAKKEGFTYPVLWKNLDIIKGQAQVFDPAKSKRVEDYGLSTILDIQYSFLIIFTLMMISGVIQMVRKNLITNKAILVVIGLLLLTPIGVREYYESQYRFAIALEPIRVFEGPSKVFTELGEITEGSRLIVGELKTGWYFIKSPRSVQGWVAKENLAFY